MGTRSVSAQPLPLKHENLLRLLNLNIKCNDIMNGEAYEKFSSSGIFSDLMILNIDIIVIRYNVI